MMGCCRAAVFSFVVFAAVAAAPAALAGTPGHWTRITDMTASNIDEVTLARTTDGVLHAAWTRPTPSNPGSGRDLLELPISAGGAAGSPVLVASNYATLENPSAIATGGSGLELFVGAIHSTDTSDPIQNLVYFTSGDGGQSWSGPGYPGVTGGAAYGSNVAVALGSGGTPFETWGSSSCLCVHMGLDPSTPNADFQQGLGDFGYEPGIALDPASGMLVVAWYSNGTGHDGVYAAPVDQSTGALAGAAVQMPGTSNLLDGPFSGRTPIVARSGGGVYVAYEGGYPAHTRVLLWKVGAPSSLVLGQNAADVHSVGLASTPNGPLWVFWSAQSPSGASIVYARRSNPSATAWGQTVVVKAPPGATSSWNLVGSGQTDRLDLVGSFSLGSSSTAASWHTQVLPGLTLGASQTQLHKQTKHAQKVTFSVADAGTPLSGSNVRVGNVSGKTNAKGRVTLALGPFTRRSRLVAQASRTNYVGAAVTLTVR